MTSTLEQRHLEQIFRFLTPLEWIEVSKVCQLWKKAASKQWERITKIRYKKYLLGEEEKRIGTNIPILPAEKCEEIAIHAAKFVQELKACSHPFYEDPDSDDFSYDDSSHDNSTHDDSCHDFNLDDSSCKDEEKFVMFEHYWYKVDNFNSNKFLQLVAENSTQIKKVQFDAPPRIELIKLLFKNNKKIEVLGASDSNGFYRKIPTEGIEKLSLHFEDTYKSRSFKGKFPNLKELTLSVDGIDNDDPIGCLANILPYIRKIQSLNLYISLQTDVDSLSELNNSFRTHSESFEMLWDIVSFSQLEELTIELDHIQIESVESFIHKLVLCCSKLRIVKLKKFKVNERALHSLMLLRDLEILEVISVTGFDSMEVPEMMNLTKFKISFSRLSAYDQRLMITHLCNAVEKMPKLESLEIDGLDEEQTLKLTCHAITVAASHKKDVVVNGVEEDRGCSKLRIEEQSGVKSQTLELKILKHDEKTYFENLKAFVEKELKSHQAFVFENEEEKGKCLKKNEKGSF